jgi:hypothetical protein
VAFASSTSATEAFFLFLAFCPLSRMRLVNSRALGFCGAGTRKGGGAELRGAEEDLADRSEYIRIKVGACLHAATAFL